MSEIHSFYFFPTKLKRHKKLYNKGNEFWDSGLSKAILVKILLNYKLSNFSINNAQWDCEVTIIKSTFW